MRTLTAAIITAGLVVSLSACASGASTDASASCDTTAPRSGDASALVTATGDTGTELTVDFPTPLVTKGIEVSAVTTGDGRTLQTGDAADFHLQVTNGETGEAMPITDLEADSIIRRTAGSDDAFGTALECATVGSRLAVTVTTEAAGFSGGSLEADDTIVLVIDVVRGFPGRATGVDVLPQNGLPAVVLAPGGAPGIVVPHSDAPESLQIATLKQGDGTKVKEDDAVVVNYSAIVWGADDLFASTWTDVDAATPYGVPQTLLVTDDATGAGNGVIPGLTKALVGAEVGSQIVVVAPPGKSGYADDATLPSGVTAEDTLVYVIDVLGIQ